jgi:hypothetical protein
MPACAFLASERTLPVGFSYPLRPTAATGTRVTTAFRRAIDSSDPSASNELRAATLAFAATLRAEGLPPEQALVALKRVLAQHGWCLSLFQACRIDGEFGTSASRMYPRVFRWFLEGYYGLPRPG